MKPEELFTKVKELISSGNLDSAKDFINEHQDELGDYFEKAKALLSQDGSLLDKAKNLFK